MKRPLGLRYDQILLEITNGQQEQRRSTLVDLPTPAGPPEIPPVGQENPAASSTGQAQIQSPATGLQTSKTRAPGYIYPASSAATSPTTATDRQGACRGLGRPYREPGIDQDPADSPTACRPWENIYLSSVKQPCRQSQCKSAVCTRSPTSGTSSGRSIPPRSCDSTSLTWLKRSLCTSAPQARSSGFRAVWVTYREPNEDREITDSALHLMTLLQALSGQVQVVLNSHDQQTCRDAPGRVSILSWPRSVAAGPTHHKRSAILPGRQAQ